jgi:hypothetical protein
MPTATDWISSIANALSAAGVLFGIAIAWKQLHNWKNQSKIQRKVETAEQILSSAYSVVDLIKAVRSPLESVPKDQINNKTYVLDQKLRRLGEGSSVFESLRLAQIKARTLLQDQKVDAAIEKLFQSRLDFWNGVDVLADYVDARTLTQEEKNLVKEARQRVFATYGPHDTLHQQMMNALTELDRYLGPIVRLND